ncbi:TPA: hypothetical protein GXZ54_03170 [bacterium]|jgi:hypothetical protein|nr:hypothetical protein [bacterium]
MYNRTRRKNLTSFDYFIRVVFVVLLVGFVFTVLLLEPYLEKLTNINLELKNEVTELKEENERIDVLNKHNFTILKND